MLTEQMAIWRSTIYGCQQRNSKDGDDAISVVLQRYSSALGLWMCCISPTVKGTRSPATRLPMEIVDSVFLISWHFDANWVV